MKKLFYKVLHYLAGCNDCYWEVERINCIDQNMERSELLLITCKACGKILHK